MRIVCHGLLALPALKPNRLRLRTTNTRKRFLDSRLGPIVLSAQVSVSRAARNNKLDTSVPQPIRLIRTMPVYILGTYLCSQPRSSELSCRFTCQHVKPRWHRSLLDFTWHTWGKRGPDVRAVVSVDHNVETRVRHTCTAEVQALRQTIGAFVYRHLRKSMSLFWYKDGGHIVRH